MRVFTVFAGLSVIAVGDLYQLPPINRKPVFSEYKTKTRNLYHPWQVFTMIELTEIMRQKDDQHFAELLNRFRTGSQTDKDVNCINSRLISPSADNYPVDALHVWTENVPVNEYNNKRLEQLSSPLFILKANDQYPSQVTQKDINTVLSKARSDTGGLDFEIKIKEGARVMLTTNIDIAGGLRNGQMGTAMKINVNKLIQKPSVIYIKFDDERAGNALIQISGDSFAQQNKVVPIEPVLSKIKVHPGKPSSLELQRIQFPVTLAWACTIHKVQGLSLLQLWTSASLSRATSLQGLHILNELNSKHVKVDSRVRDEYSRLRRFKPNHVHEIVPANHQNNSDITLCLLNIRSLRKHSCDIKCDVNLFQSDILALTETQLLPRDTL